MNEQEISSFSDIYTIIHANQYLKIRLMKAIDNLPNK